MILVKSPARNNQWDGTADVWLALAACIANGEDARAFAGIIDRKIAKLKRDQRILNWGATVGGFAGAKPRPRFPKQSAFQSFHRNQGLHMIYELLGSSVAENGGQHATHNGGASRQASARTEFAA